MNLIFTVVFVISIIIFIFTNPELALKAMTNGASKAVTLSLTLTAVYSIWAGVNEVAERTGITDKLSKLLSKPIDLLFNRPNAETKKHLSQNIAANLFGLGGIATPAGINAANLLSEKEDKDGMDTLFVLSATSIQLFPTTVISLREQYGSASPSDIFLPTLLSTVVSTAVGLFLLYLTRKLRRKR